MNSQPITSLWLIAVVSLSAQESLKRIKAIADVLTNLERNGYTDELFDGSLHGLMGVIDHEVETAKKLLTY